MTFKQLVLKMCRKEKGKKQVNVAQMSEIVSKLSVMMAANNQVTVVMIVHGIEKLMGKKVKK